VKLSRGLGQLNVHSFFSQKKTEEEGDVCAVAYTKVCTERGTFGGDFVYNLR